MSGRPAKPAALRVLEGNPAHRPIAQEPRPAVGGPQKPAKLSKRAEELWDQITAEWVPIGLLTKLDGGDLARYCQITGMCEELEADLSANGYTYDAFVILDDSQEPKQDIGGVAKIVKKIRPEAQFYARLVPISRQLGAGLGLSPVSRAHLAIPAEKPEKGELESLLTK